MNKNISICWLGQGGFLIEASDFRVLIDPYLSDCVFKKDGFARLHPFPLPLDELRPDLLLTTHDHIDHFDPEGIPELLAMYPQCLCAGPQRSYEHFKTLGVAPEKLTLCSIGNSFTAGAFKISAVPAFHSDPTACGYVLEVSGKKIVITGDTIFDERLFVPEIYRADLFLICINGKLGNMNANEALKVVRETKPLVAAPMHIGLFAENTADPQGFINGCQASGIRTFTMTPGEFFSL